jgi:hypothetical protein
MIAELRRRDPLLFWTGALFLLGLVVVTLLSISDTRLILGINPWIKPMKFLVSTTIFLWTVAWFMPETEPRPRARNFVRRTTSGTMLLEITFVILQSARGTPSHFNQATPFDAIVFAVMGLLIFLNTIAIGVLLWIIRRDTPASRAGYLWGVRLGVAMLLVSSFEGLAIVANNAHTVSQPDGGPGLPFVNWSTTAGDLRVAHFFSMHGMQAMPILGFLLDRAGAPARRNIVFAAAVLWLAVTGVLLRLALQGRPLLAL